MKRALGNIGAGYNAVAHLQTAMVNAGLKLDESNALIDTWRNSYFDKEKGLKVLWIVPRAVTDKILPLSIKPIPDKIERVIVGRSEILTPEFEDYLLRQNHLGKMDQFVNNKYYLPYLDFVQNKYLMRASVSAIQNKTSDGQKFHFDSRLKNTNRWKLDGRWFLPHSK